MTSWVRYEVAFPMPCPTLATRVMLQTGGFERGAASHWVEWHPESNLLVFRSSLSVRSGQTSADAANRAQAFWAAGWEGRIAGVPDPREDRARRLCWAWRSDESITS